LHPPCTVMRHERTLLLLCVMPIAPYTRALLLPRRTPVWTAVSNLRMASSGPDVRFLCAALQTSSDETPEGLSDALSSQKSARSFFSEYFSGEEWTCADYSEPPQALVDCLLTAPATIADVVLLHVLTGAATSCERTSSRARVLVNALWDKAPALQQSCAALNDTLAAKLGAQVQVVWDQELEYAKDNWASLLSLFPYERDQLQRASKALTLCGGDSSGKVVPVQ